jgi:hypothetical protein
VSRYDPLQTQEFAKSLDQFVCGVMENDMSRMNADDPETRNNSGINFTLFDQLSHLSNLNKQYFRQLLFVQTRSLPLSIFK